MLKNYRSFMDQQDAPVPLLCCVAEDDISPSYEIDEGAIFKTVDGKYIGVIISGCS